jgi:hypothetical protein
MRLPEPEALEPDFPSVFGADEKIVRDELAVFVEPRGIPVVGQAQKAILAIPFGNENPEYNFLLIGR